MITIKSNSSLKNVGKNSLKEKQLLQNTVFFGINGSGKTTICEILRGQTTFEFNSSTPNGQPHIYSFDEQWRSERVGKFIEGGSADSVVTVRLNDDANALEERIGQAASQLKSATAELSQKETEKREAENRLNEIVNNVSHGIRNQLKLKCARLDGRSFKRAQIQSILQGNKAQILSEDEIKTKIEIANSKSPGSIPHVPHLPETWNFSTDLWHKLNEISRTANTLELNINDWVREGFALHSAGDNCQFCDGVVTNERIQEITNAIQAASKQIPREAHTELEACCKSIQSFDNFIRNLRTLSFSDSIYSDNLDYLKIRTIEAAHVILEELSRGKEILSTAIQTPQGIDGLTIPELDFAPVTHAYQELSTARSAAAQKIDDHTKNQNQAVEELKQHCCAKDGDGWNAAVCALKESNTAVKHAEESCNDARQTLQDLKQQVSTTAETAEFLDSRLEQILGEKILRITEGEEGEGYRITRRNQKADGMSEGEKKLVSLLYFCAEFLAEDRKSNISNSIIIFDDLASELDEPRLLAIDRFISNFFQDPHPAACVFFTHSHTYLKILQSRLVKRALHNAKSRKAIFYEVYKNNFIDADATTFCREWDDQELKLTNDYWLAFYKVLCAFEELTNGKTPDPGIGNFCRKVLEGFSEFRAPGNDNFGSRIDTMLTQSDPPASLSPALSKIVNKLSHSSLGKDGGAMLRNETELAILQTLNLLRVFDGEHFRALLRKFKGKGGDIDIESKLIRRLAID